MDINLHTDIERFIREQVSSGGYASPEEVVTEALFLLWQRDLRSPPGSPRDGPKGPLANHA